MEADRPDGTGPLAEEQTVDFGWEDDAPVSGRRLKREREQKRKLKPGSFGERRLCLFIVLASVQSVVQAGTFSAQRTSLREKTACHVRQRRWG